MSGCLDAWMSGCLFGSICTYAYTCLRTDVQTDRQNACRDACVGRWLGSYINIGMAPATVVITSPVRLTVSSEATKVPTSCTMLKLRGSISKAWA